MLKIITEFNAKKQELNCGTNIIPVIKYLEDLYGIQKTKQIVEPLGLNLAFLTNKRNWVSYEYYNILLEKLVEITGNKKSPFFAPFSMKIKNVFDDIYYGTYMALFSDSPKQGYKLAFNEKITSRFTKIGSFKILSESKNSLTIKLILKKDYNQTKNNCLMIQGFFSSTTVGWGIPPATVTHEECATEGAQSCIYKVEWFEKKKYFTVSKYVILIIIIIIEYFLFKNDIINIKDIIISFFSLTSVYIFLKYLIFFNTKNKEEIFNYKKNISILDAMEEIENNYHEINIIKQELENRNIFLSIINEVSERITSIENFNLLLFEVSKILVNRLYFLKGIYFQIGKNNKYYTSIFKINNKIYIDESGLKENLNKIDHKIDLSNIFEIEKQKYNNSDIRISIDDYQKIKLINKSISLKELNEKKIIEDEIILNKISTDWNDIIYFIPVDTYDNFAGFFCYVSKKKEILPQKLILDLFNNISIQLQIGYEKISSNAIIENILSSIPAYVLLFNIENKEIKYVNTIFLESFPLIDEEKRNLDDIVGKNIFNIIPFNEQSIININNYLDNMTVNFKIENFQVSFEKKVFEYSIFNIKQNNQKDIYAGIILTDITETINFEQKIILNEKLLALGKVASGIAHEINNPLYVVLANAEEISEDNNVSPEIKQYAEEIVEYAINISNIIKDLSTYSKSLRNELIVDVDINNIIEESFKIVKYSLNFLNVEIIKNFSEIPKINAAKGEIEQVFINLIKNALHAMDDVGKIEIGTYIEDNIIIAYVKDTGYGISKENIPLIYDLFFTTKKEDEGTGQGLHIVKKILSKYHFDIKVESEVNKGTTFYLYFPVNK